MVPVNKGAAMSQVIAITIFTLVSFLSPALQAAAVTWTLEGITFDDSGTATGTFNYDADMNTYSDINITTQGGDTLNFGGKYTQLFTEAASNSGELKTETFPCGTIAGSCVFGLNFATNLMNAGGSINILADNAISIEGFYGPTRNIISGSVSAVPVPAAVWLFGSALAGLGWLRRKRTG